MEKTAIDVIWEGNSFCNQKVIESYYLKMIEEFEHKISICKDVLSVLRGVE